MKFTLQFPMRAMNHWDDWIGEHSLGELAAAAEEVGFDLVSSTDHPFPDAQWVKAGGHHAFDPFVSLAFMAAATTRIGLLTMLVVSGYRNPYVTAKAASSLDNLSRGRLVLGMGAGYSEAEFDVLGADFAGRGPRLDAALTAMRAAWTGEVVSHDDPYYPAHGHVMLPRPARSGGPPIWFGGNSRAALRRVAEVGDGWMPIEQGPEMAALTGTPPLGLPDLPGHVEALRSHRRELGRSEDVSVSWAPHPARGAEAQAAGIGEGLPDYAAAGATHVLVEARARSFGELLTELEFYRPVIAGA